MRRKKRRIIDFKPQYLEDYDYRYGAAKKIRAIYLDFKKQCKINSTAKDLLARRAAYLSVRLDTLEVQSLTGKKVDQSVLTQLTNAFVGILKQLGLENLDAAAGPETLREYVARKSRLKAEKAERKRRRESRNANSKSQLVGSR
jgi:hypothetical protein